MQTPQRAGMQWAIQGAGETRTGQTHSADQTTPPTPRKVNTASKEFPVVIDQLPCSPRMRPAGNHTATAACVPIGILAGLSLPWALLAVRSRQRERLATLYETKEVSMVCVYLGKCRKLIRRRLHGVRASGWWRRRNWFPVSLFSVGHQRTGENSRGAYRGACCCVGRFDVRRGWWCSPSVELCGTELTK